jgi:ABC-type iron transport system FetAB permease component
VDRSQIFRGARSQTILHCSNLNWNTWANLVADRDAICVGDATLIPQINSLFAVGLVALPGMMTGQILSGVDPNIAVRYQIMVMWMIFGSGCIAAVIYLVLRTRMVIQKYER